jgi:hypothetical protein
MLLNDLLPGVLIFVSKIILVCFPMKVKFASILGKVYFVHILILLPIKNFFILLNIEFASKKNVAVKYRSSSCGLLWLPMKQKIASIVTQNWLH